jgi:hypothetical protein
MSRALIACVYPLTFSLLISLISLVDPAMSHVSPSTEDQEDSWSGDMDQNSIAPAGDSNIEGIVSDTISANFPQVTYLCENQKIVKIILSLEFDVCGHDRWTTGI